MTNVPYRFDSNGRAICLLCKNKYSRIEIPAHYKKCLDAQSNFKVKKKKKEYSKSERKLISQALKISKEKSVECMFCSKTIKQDRYYDHVILVHSKEYDTYLSKKSKRYRLNRKFGPDEPFNDSRDLFEKYVIVSGGGFGVGKGKKS